VLRNFQKKMTFETLERRTMLSGNSPIISEFMASNADTLADEDDDFSDWIEIYNPADTTANLDRWYLTDDATNLTKWRFPAVSIDPGGYLVVFASAKNRLDPTELHTNFELDAGGEYLALVEPDGVTPAHRFAPEYPQQYKDVSYGITQDSATLVAEGVELSYLVPTAGDAAADWTASGYDDSHWHDTVTEDGSALLITEIASGDVDAVEIQNVSDRAVDATGWIVAVNDGSADNVNQVNSQVWSLPDWITAGDVLYKNDDAGGGNYWGSDIQWDAEGAGWVMILDDGGRVVDFLAWGYGQADIAGLNVDVGEHTNVTVGDQWSGAGADVGTSDPGGGGPGESQFVAFNDHIVGAGTHPNATSYSAYSGPSFGVLKDIESGEDTDVTLAVTQSGVNWEGTQGAPAAGTDAYNIFNGFVDFGTGSGSSIAISGADHQTHTFTGLEAGGATYSFAGTAVRGASYTDRWTLVSLEGADSSTAAHSAGIGVVIVSPTEAAIWVGQNQNPGQGFVAAWTDIDPGTDGEFSIVSRQFTGETPGVGSGMATGGKGYGITGIRLEMLGPGGPKSWLKREGNADGNSAADFTRTTGSSEGQQNPKLTVPFNDGDVRPVTSGIGFKTDPENFQVTRYQANVPVADLATAEQVIATPSLQSSATAGTAEVINYLNTGGDGHYAENSPFPGTTIGVDVDDFVIEVTGTVVIPVAGYWTFGVNSDEGFSLELSRGGETFSISHDAGRIPADTLYAFNLPEPGAYDLRLVHFERDQGAELELFSASGIHATFDAGAFDLVGDTGSGGLAVTGFGGAIQTDVEEEMHEVNASLWTRTLFHADDVSAWDSMLLRMKYNDGFVAYLNGQRIAGRNAPASPAWNSTATTGRSYQDSLTYEEIDISEYLGNLAPGLNVLAIQGLNEAAGDDDFVVLAELDVSSGTSVQRYFDVPTPGELNGEGFIDYVRDTEFSVDRGFFTLPFQVAITSDTPSTTIRYTTDGSQPTELSGTDYTGPLTIDSTTTLRAVAFKEDHHPTNVDTQTYIYLDDVLAQSPTGQAPAGWPSGPIDDQVLDYGMDPDIVDDAVWGPQLEDALTSIPTISLVTDVDNLMNPSDGIYVNSSQDGIAWERPVSVELIQPAGSAGDGEFQLDAGLRIRGSESAVGDNPKHAFRLFFREEYGKGNLEFPLFGEEGVDSFDKIDLRTAQGYSWSYQGSAENTMLRDVFARDTQRDLGQAYTRSGFYHLYINGQYWGLYQTQERSEAAYGKSYFGGAREDYDVIKVDPSADYTIVATDGNIDAWQNLWNLAGSGGNSGFASDAAYYHAQGLDPATQQRDPAYPVLLDVDNLIDYMLVILYTGDRDSPISELLGDDDPNNWYGVRDRNGEEGFQFFVHDAENTLSVGAEDRTGPFSTGDAFNKSNPQWLHQQLMASDDYRLRFADRAQECLLNDGLLSAGASAARLQARADEIGMAIIAESARWGDAQRATPFDKDDWLAALDNELNASTGFFAGRSQTVIDQLKVTTLIDGAPAPLYPGVAVATFNQHGGQVNTPFPVTLSAPQGMIYYTLDGSDPRDPDGSVSENATRFVATPFSITASTVVKARVLDGGQWSALNKATFFIGHPAGDGNLAITELNYNPSAPTAAELDDNPQFNNDSFEFIELHNTTEGTLDLTGMSLAGGVTMQFGPGQLAPGAYAVVVSDPAAFAARYGTGIDVLGQYGGHLDNNGEWLALLDRSGAAIHDFSYNDSGAWPGRADGKGSSLEVLNTAGNYSDDDNWRSSSEYGGSPGSEGAGPVVDVVINEVLSRPLPADVDAIELYNASGTTVYVGGWYLSDSSDNYRKFRIPEGPASIMFPGGFLVFDETDFNDPNDPNDPNRFMLDGSAGDDVWLLQAEVNGTLTRFADHVKFGESLEGKSFGRSPDGSEAFGMMSQETIGEANGNLRVGAIVINELHVRPDVKTEPVEYIELYNAGSVSVDLAGWYFSKGVSYTFPEDGSVNTVIPAGGYAVIAQDPAAAQAKFGGPLPFGPYLGKLSNESDRLVLRDAADIKQDEVDYQLGFPWPTVGDAPGYSMELINPALDNDLAGSWRSSSGTATEQQWLIPVHSEWRYFKGTEEPSAVQGAWREIGFDDSGWETGFGAVGYSSEGDEMGIIRETLADMNGLYSTVYLRQEFQVDDPNAFAQLLLEARYDDGFNCWINGRFFDGANAGGQELPYTATASGNANDNIEFVPFTLSNPADYLVAGTNVIAVQLLNRQLSGSSDAFFDCQMRSSTGGEAGLTPGAQNSVYTSNAPPQMRQLDHSPKQPASGEDVSVTVKVTDPDGVGSVELAYQLVEPGDYINIEDPRYENPVYWTTVPMFDDGTQGDEFADDVYTAVLPGTLHTNRLLVRYRITVEDTLGAAVTAPYADDPQPNFAYYVYDGVPRWTGSAQPGVEPEVTYSSELLTSIPVYTLITQRQDRLDAIHVPYRWGEADQQVPLTGSYGGSDYPWHGTLVYDGVVYDHVSYRARGGCWRYSMGKNMWKFDFNRGHYFQAHDDYGNEYATRWDKLNFSAMIQQGNFRQRGEQGLFEGGGFKLHNLADNAASNTNYLHFRLVEDADEGGPDQFSSDFQGLYMTLEQPDGHLLDEHGLPDGNFYKMEGGTGTLNNQGPTQPSDRSDLNAFKSAFESGTMDAQWWRDNFDLEGYYNFRAIAMAIHDYDIGSGKNYFYYHNPETGKWSIHNWDLDLCWTTTYGGSGGREPFRDILLNSGNFPEFVIEYNNRMREIIDLLFNPEQTGMILDEVAQFVYTPGEPSLVDADAAMWDYNPILVSNYINSSKASHGRYYESSPTDDFAGMIQYEKNYVANRIQGDTTDPTISSDSSQAPYKPTIAYIGQDGFPVDGLDFQSSAFGSPVGASPAGMQWRIARVTDPTSPEFDPWQPRHYEITAAWEQEIAYFDDTITMDGENVEVGGTYRARVRMKDDNGRWGHWSDPVQFVAGGAVGPLADGLRITELNYAPHAPTPAELAIDDSFTAEDFEFVELRNTTGRELGLGGVRFTDGIEFTFPQGSLLWPGESVVVVRNLDAFEARYGSEIYVAGSYGPFSLKNEGEHIELLDPFERVIHDFTYAPSGAWPGRANGKGSTLEVIDTASDYGDSENWRSSTEYGGSPGEVGSGWIGDVVINEVLTHTDPPQSDTIELYNTTGTTIDVSGWYLSDSSGNYRKFGILDETLIGGGEYVVFDEDDINPTPWDPGPNDFSFSGAFGDDVWLLATDQYGNFTRFVDHVEFPAAAGGESFGRWPNGSGELYPMTEPTVDPANGENSGPRVGPVVISEVQYNPRVDPFETTDPADLEFIEIFNPTGAEVDLSDWKIRKGIDFDFPAGAKLASGAAVVVVSFDLDDTDKLTAFRQHYGIDGPALVNSVQLLGGYSEQLNNAGERVQLQRPDEPPSEDPDYTPMLWEDEVIYDDSGAWPAEADGGGASLNRLAKNAWGNDSSSWAAASPTPGWASALGATGVVSQYVFYNGSASGSIAADKQALMSGSEATFANYTSYNRGLNGIIVDIDGLPDWQLLDAGDFQFHTGNSNTPGDWGNAPLPNGLTVSPGQGDNGSDRVTITWPDHAIENQWLEVTVTAGGDTGLSAPHVFYFGNAPGESGNSTADAAVNAADVLLTRNNPRGFLNPAPADFNYDFNRDGRVNATDMLIARSNQTHFLNALRLITPSEDKAAVEEPGNDKAAAAELPWLYQFEQTDTGKRSSKESNSNEKAVDLLMVTSDYS